MMCNKTTFLLLLVSLVALVSGTEDSSSLFQKNPQLKEILLRDPTVEPRYLFISFCQQNYIINSKLFAGSCPLTQEELPTNLNITEQQIYDFDQTASVDTLLRKLVENSTKYFEATYPEYQTVLTAFKNGMDGIATRLKNEFPSVILMDIYNVYQTSGMEEAALAIIKKYTDQMNALEGDEFLSFQNVTFCKSDSNFCPKTRDMFDIVRSEHHSSLAMKQFLINCVENSYKFFSESAFGSATLIVHKEALIKLIEDLSQAGTGGMLVSRISDALKSNSLLRTIISFYHPDATFLTRRTRTTTTTTTRTTTTKQKVQDVYAVSMPVLILIPTFMVLIGFGFALGLMYKKYQFRPVESHLEPRPKNINELHEMDEYKIEKDYKSIRY